MRRFALFAFILLAVMALLFQQGLFLISDPAAAQPLPEQFLDVTRSAGLTYSRTPNTERSIGQAWGDYDQDGWVDLYVTDPLGANYLYHNQGDGTFALSPFSDQVALSSAYSNGAVFADYDNDGWPDLFVTNWGQNNLFHNNQGKGFEDVTQSAGLLRLAGANSRSASWGDYDNDGYLDLYVATWSCYPKCGRPSEGEIDQFYHNNGDGTFKDVTRYLSGKTAGAGFIAGFTDYNNDGRLDIFLVNDEFIHPVGTALWRNDGPGCSGWCFKDVAREAGAEIKLFGMGLATGDYNNDGLIDLFFTNGGPMAFLQNQDGASFKNIAVPAGVEESNAIAWGATFLDYDNDGWRDLYIAVMETATGKDIASNPLFHNNGDGTFSKVECRVGVSDVHASMGVNYADYNHDGWPDLLVGNMDNGYRLYSNQGARLSLHTWLSLELTGAGPVNRDAVGARVYVTTPDGKRQLQEVVLGASLGGGNELALLYGLGDAKTADLEIIWPDGTHQEFKNVSANQRLRLSYPQTGATELQSLPVTPPVAQAGAPGYYDWPAAAALAFALILVIFLLFNARKTLFAPLSIYQRYGWTAAGLVALLLFVWMATDFSKAWRTPLWSAVTKGQKLQVLLDQAGVRPLTRLQNKPELVALGRALFWDPELSGNRDVACATCHHASFATGDGLAVSVGTLGVGIGPERVPPDDRRLVPRNAPPVFNFGYAEWTVLFVDGRVSGDPHHGFATPAFNDLPEGLDSVLAAQAMFPVTSREEMRGEIGDTAVDGRKNELALELNVDWKGIWAALMKRLVAIPEYVDLFQKAYPDVPVEKMGFEFAANALAAYQAETFTFEDSPWDAYLQGNQNALTSQQLDGALLFYGEAGCATCHSGGLMTDQKFHNIAVPQIGPGKGRDRPFDLGRARETGNDCDRFAFRTPPLANVAITGPWMHDGAYDTLEAAVRHHMNMTGSLRAYDGSRLAAYLQPMVRSSEKFWTPIEATCQPIPVPSTLTDAQVNDLLAFLNALTSPSAVDMQHLIPAAVPSGLKVGGN